MDLYTTQPNIAGLVSLTIEKSLRILAISKLDLKITFS